MSKLNEVIDSLNNENVEEVKEKLTSEAKTLNENNRRLYSRAKKAEGFIKDEKGEWKKQEKPENPEPKEPKQSDEPDYAKLAYLKAEGINHPDDQKSIQDEANRLKMTLTDVLNMEHMKTQLKNAKDQREAEDGMPKGRGKGSTSSKANEDYWIDKKNKDGSYATPPDPELHKKVINKRLEKIEKDNVFDPIR